jgi:hypothetical protein
VSAGLTGTGAVTSGTAAVTVADDFPEPFAALSLICVTAIAVTAVLRFVHRAEDAERALADERRRRQAAEAEYAALVEDYNAVVLENAHLSAGRFQQPEHEHGPRCTCHTAQRPYLSLVGRQPRQGSA